MATIDLALSGLASGFDWKSFVDQMVEVDRTPQQRLRLDQSGINKRNTAFTNIKTQLSTLQTRIAALKDPGLYLSRTAGVSDSTLASASASTGASAGTFTFNISQLATASRLNGTTNAGKRLSETSDVSSVMLSSAAFPSAITDGTFTINGKQVEVASDDSLQDVFDTIATATGNAVTAAYDETTDRITLSSGSEIVLGSATDTSNFLQAARLFNTGTGTITSNMNLGSVRADATLTSANFTTAVTDGGAGAGVFKINGVEITYSATTDKVTDVINRINNSSAGVLASYDPTTDRFVLTSKMTGDMGIAMEDVTGNFLQASGLSTGTLSRGQNLIYTFNGSDPLTSQSNTITESSSGITGLSVTAFKDDSTFTVTVGNDTDKIKTAVKDFIEAYNRAQSLIDSQTASSTDADGKVTAGVLAGDRDADEIASRLRGLVYSQINGLTGTLKHLDDLGIVSNGNDNSLSLEDEDKLDSALTGNLDAVKDLFANSSNGLAVALDKYLTKTIGDDGTLITHQNALSKESSSIDLQIVDMERIVQANKERLTASFVSMETAQAKLSQQLSFLSRQLANL